MVGELEVANPSMGVVLMATNKKPHRWHKRAKPKFEIGDYFFGEKITRIKQMSRRNV